MNYRKADIPHCCGNCKLNDWDEDGPLCISDGKGGSFDVTNTVYPDEFNEDDARGIRWDHVCDFHVEEIEREVPPVEDKQEKLKLG